MSRLHYKNYDYIKKFARGLRNNQTESEERLWSILKGRKFDGYKFLRQHPIFYRIDGSDVQNYIADFYCSRLHLIIEVDGPVHDLRTDEDHDRDSKLIERGFYVIRIKNEEILDIKSVIIKIKSQIASIKASQTL